MSCFRLKKIVAASCLAMPSIAAAQTSGTWAVDVGTAGGSWSVGSNWAGQVPDNGGTATFIALPFSTAPLAIFADLPTVTLNQVNFQTLITYNFRAPAAAPTNSIALSGDAVLNAEIANINSLGITFFGHLVQLPITGSAGLTKRGPGTITLWQNTNSYTGGTRVEAGTLGLRQIGDAGLGDPSGGVTLDGGAIRVSTSAWVSNRAITLGSGGGTIDATLSGTTTFGGSVSGPGSLNKIGPRGLILNAANGYSGATNVLAGSIGLSGSGAIGSTAALVVRDSLVIDNVLVNLGDRINNAAPVTLHGAALTLNGHLAGASTEVIGAANFSRGTTTITVSPSPGQSATLAAGNVSRELGAAAFFRGTNLGAAPGGTFSSITFTAPPALVGGGGVSGATNISIIPWAYGNTNAAAALNASTNSFVTYGATGVRPLDINTEYASSILGAGSTENVRFNGASALGAAQTINSLILTGGGSLLGIGTLTITSGALLNTAADFAIGVPLNFGAAEGNIIAPANISFDGSISGSGGLTKQGAGVASFSPGNTYTGVTTIGGGTAAYRSDVPAGAPSPFGNSTTAIVLAPAGVGTGGTTARLVYSGTSEATFDRDLTVSGRVATSNAAILPGFGLSTSTTLTVNGNMTLDDSPMTFINNASGTLIVNGVIAGSGGPITDQSSPVGSTIRLNGQNTFEGDFELSAATWQVGSDSAFGNGGLLKMVQTGGSGPTIEAVDGPRVITNPTVSLSFTPTYWRIGGSQDVTFTGSINLSGSYTHTISNIGLTTYAGVLHTGGFTKAGTGTLVLSGDNIHTGVTTISSGVLRITHANALGSSDVPTIVAAGAALEVGDAAAVGGRAGSNELLTLNGSGIAGGGALVNVGGANSVGNISLASPSTIAVRDGALAAGNIDAADSSQDLAVSGGPLAAERVRVDELSLDGPFAIAPGRNADKTSRVTSLTTTPSTRLDLGDNDLVIDYTLFTPIDGIRTALANGYNGGSWNGNGINSSAAAGQGVTALGVAEANDIFTSFPAVFSGQSVDDSAVLIRYTRYGDANLDGITDIGDFALLGANFNTTASTWVRGDFNYDQITDIGDFALLAANFNQAPPIARSPLPEPAGAGIVLAALSRRCSRLGQVRNRKS